MSAGQTRALGGCRQAIGARECTGWHRNLGRPGALISAPIPAHSRGDHSGTRPQGGKILRRQLAWQSMCACGADPPAAEWLARAAVRVQPSSRLAAAMDSEPRSVSWGGWRRAAQRSDAPSACRRCGLTICVLDEGGESICLLEQNGRSCCGQVVALPHVSLESQRRQRGRTGGRGDAQRGQLRLGEASPTGQRVGRRLPQWDGAQAETGPEQRADTRPAHGRSSGSGSGSEEGSGRRSVKLRTKEGRCARKNSQQQSNRRCTTQRIGQMDRKSRVWMIKVERLT